MFIQPNEWQIKSHRVITSWQAVTLPLANSSRGKTHHLWTSTSIVTELVCVCVRVHNILFIYEHNTLCCVSFSPLIKLIFSWRMTNNLSLPLQEKIESSSLEFLFHHSKPTPRAREYVLFSHVCWYWWWLTRFYFQTTDLLAISVCGGVVGDLEGVEVDHILHLVDVTPPLANYDCHVKQEDVPVAPKSHNSSIRRSRPMLPAVRAHRHEADTPSHSLFRLRKKRLISVLAAPHLSCFRLSKWGTMRTSPSPFGRPKLTKGWFCRDTFGRVKVSHVSGLGIKMMQMMRMMIWTHQVFDGLLVLVNLPQRLIVSFHLVDILSQVLRDTHERNINSKTWFTYRTSSLRSLRHNGNCTVRLTKQVCRIYTLYIIYIICV